MKSPFVLRRFFVVNAFLLLAALWIAPPAFAQKGQTSMGTDFWLGFMPNSLSLTCCAPQDAEFFIASATANDVHVEVFGGSQTPNETYDHPMTANSVWTLAAPSEANWETDTTEEATYRAIHIVSRSPITVYGYQYTGANTFSGDSYLALPTPALGTDYYAVCYSDDTYLFSGPQQQQPLASQFLIVSPYDSNVVNIGPVTAPTRGDAFDAVTTHKAGESWKVTLMKGQTYLVQSTGQNWGSELTGTPIASSQPIGVISGNQLTSVGQDDAENFSKSMLTEMMLPVEEWDSEYYDVPTATTTSGNLIRVIAGEDNETITNGLDGNTTALLLHAGDYHDFELINSPIVLSSQGGKPFLAVQMHYSYGFRFDSTLTSPFSLTLPPVRQFQKSMIFSTMQRPDITNYATFFCREDSLPNISVNGKMLSRYAYGAAPRFTILGTKPTIGTYTIELPDTTLTYLATSGAPFGCYIYGLSLDESYGSPAGMSLNISSADSLPPAESHDSLCAQFQVRLTDVRRPPQVSFVDSKIADIGMIADSNDLRWPNPSYNFELSFDSTHLFTTGDSIASFNLTVLDPSKNAYAAVWTTDRAGNDTVYEYTYHAPQLTSPTTLPFEFGKNLIGADTCRHITLANSTIAPLILGSESIEGVASAGKFTVSPDTIGWTLAPGDSVHFDLCFASSDTLRSFDTLIVTVGCAPFRYPLEGLGITPLILAHDFDFGSVAVGDRVCQPVGVFNVGKAPLVLYANSLLSDTLDFSFLTLNQFPFTIAPGSSASLLLCFHPRTAGPVQTRLDWATNLYPPFTHSIKDTSLLTGVGASDGINQSLPNSAFALSISPNPASGSAMISLTGAPSANVEIFDVLGREVTNFRIEGYYEWQTGLLPAGAYIVRAEAGGRILSKRMLKQ